MQRFHRIFWCDWLVQIKTLVVVGSAEKQIGLESRFVRMYIYPYL